MMRAGIIAAIHVAAVLTGGSGVAGAAVVETCNGLYTFDYTAAIELCTGKDAVNAPVCAGGTTGTTYKNIACARCNDELDLSPGKCTSSSAPLLAGCGGASISKVAENAKCMYANTAEVTCYRGKEYYHPMCAQCAGAYFEDLRFGSCDAVVESACPSATPDAVASAACEGVQFDYHGGYVCASGTTYRNADCAKCNREIDSGIRNGPCNTAVHTCVATDCGPNAVCSATVADCDFNTDGRTCGWGSYQPNGRDAEGEWTQMARLADDKEKTILSARNAKGSFMVNKYTLDTGNWASVLKSADGVSLDSLKGCAISFWMAIGTEGITGATLSVEAATSKKAEPLWTLPDSARANTWTRFEVDLATQIKSLSSKDELVFSFGTQLGDADDYVAIDDIAVTCGTDNDGQSSSKPDWAGECACSPGYQYGVSLPDQTSLASECNADLTLATSRGIATCQPNMLTALKMDGRFSTFVKIISQSGSSKQWTSELEQQSPRFTLLAPTDAAFKSMGVDSTRNLLIPDTGVDHNDLIRKFFKLHKLKKEYLPSCLAHPQAGEDETHATQLLTEEGRGLTVTATVPNYMLGDKVTIVNHISAANGQIFAIDHALEEEWVRPVSTADYCDSCDKNAECTDNTPQQGCPGGCRARIDKSGTAKGADGASCVTTSANLQREDDWCVIISAVKQTYSSKCLAESALANAKATDESMYAGLCVFPACACKTGWTGDGHFCAKATTTVAPRVTKTSTTLADGKMMPETWFYMNGSYGFVIGGRRAMRDSHFQQAVREAFMKPELGVATPGESAALGVEIFPSARMPGFILVRVSGFNMPGVLERIDNAVAAGKVECWFKHEDSSYNDAALQNTKFVAAPHNDLLPPISRYVFYIDEDYDKEVCRPNDYGFCQNEFVNSEDFVSAIQWTIEFKAKLGKEVADEANVYLWPSRCKRPGLENKIEIEATAFYFNSKYLDTLRFAVEKGLLSVDLKQKFSNGGDGNENTVQSKPIPWGHRYTSGVTDVPTPTAVMQPKPGYYGTSQVAGLVTIDINADRFLLNYELVGLGPKEKGVVAIHNGSSCITPGGRYTELAVDPWANPELWYDSYLDGSATGAFAVRTTSAQAQIEDVLDMVVIVSNEKKEQIGCGKITFSPPIVGWGDGAGGSAIGYGNSTSGANDDDVHFHHDHDFTGELVAVFVLVFGMLIAFHVKNKKEKAKQAAAASAGAGPIVGSPADAYVQGEGAGAGATYPEPAAPPPSSFSNPNYDYAAGDELPMAPEANDESGEAATSGYMDVAAPADAGANATSGYMDVTVAGADGSVDPDAV